MQKRVLLIDPWGTANTSEYLNGLIFGISQRCDLYVFTNYYFKLKTNSSVQINRVFFRYTENKNRGLYRTAIRGIEYYYGYKRIISYLKKQKRPFDVIHINWLLKYDMDKFFLKVLKKHTKKLIYTAHNVIPNNEGEKSIKKLEPIYALCDRIVVHGDSVAKERSEERR